jgi:two-component system, chemotaxis family, chemotaxis protein CheY
MKHCLVVDDSGSIRKVAQRILQDAKFRTSEATTRSEALDKCRREMPDCIIVDWQMPDGDAMSFMAQLRALPGGDKVKILYMTSENDPVHVARALRSGADVHMMKPFDKESFIRPLTEAGMVKAA